jgi:tRNA1(Val) A37 N6-methylase TrmN6
VSEPGATSGTLLGGRVRLAQPATGYRVAIDPVFLAAAVPARNGERVLELGAGVGAASLCLAARVAGVSVLGVEREVAAVALAQANAGANGVESRVTFSAGDVRGLKLAAGDAGYDHVMANPPYRAPGDGTPSPDGAKERAHGEDAGGLADWVDAALRLLRPKGTLTFIFRADRLDDLLVELQGRAGQATVYPLWPKRHQSPKRIVLRARKSMQGGVTLLPGLVLHEEDGRFTAAAEAVLREGRALPFPA